MASVESGGSALLQFSQVGLSSSTYIPFLCAHIDRAKGVAVFCLSRRVGVNELDTLLGTVFVHDY